MRHLSLGRWAFVFFLVCGCQDYDCHDLANCIEVDAGEGEVNAWSDGASSAVSTSGDAEAFSSRPASSTGGSQISTGDTVSSEQRTEGVPIPELQPDGSSCAESEECASGHCTDGFCCESECDGVCSACNVPAEEGRCVSPETDDDCAAGACPADTECLKYISTAGRCSARGVCALEDRCIPQPMNAGAGCMGEAGTCRDGECSVTGKRGLAEECQGDDECGSGHCVLTETSVRICCDSACNGLCQACSSEGHCAITPAIEPACEPVHCPADLACLTYPPPLPANSCRAFGVCWDQASYCTPGIAEAEASCSTEGRPGMCDGEGVCRATIICGDGVTEGNEECDDANQVESDSCTNNCTLPKCGDGIIHASKGELCDDGNSSNGDGCSRDCVSGFAPKGSSMLTSVHLCGIRTNATVSCWGLNTSGELGRGSTSSSGLLMPGRVLNENDVVDIAMSGSTTCAVRASGEVACWGAGFGAVPTKLSGISDATQVSAGDNMDFCARRSNGEVSCWKVDGLVAPFAGLEGAIQVALGNNHSCSLLSGGVTYCWGANAAGEGGRAGSLGGPRAVTPTRASLLSAALQLAAGYRYTCYIAAAGDQIQCVGDSQTLGNPSAASGIDPVTVLNIPNPEKLASGAQHVCALTLDGRVWCWGQGAAAGTATVNYAPAEVALPASAIDVGAGSQTSCALLEDGSTYCWGAYAPTSQSVAPVLIAL